MGSRDLRIVPHEVEAVVIAQIIHDYLILFAMVNAVGNLPVFADLTCGLDKSARHKTYRIALLTGAGIVVSFAVFGSLILTNVFSVSTDSFKIAGGILVFAVAAKGVISGFQRKSNATPDYENIAVFPLGFPFLAGPGTIVTTILLLQTSGSLITVAVAVLVYLSIYPILQLAGVLEKALGRVAILVIARILCIFICAKAVAFILEGLKSYLA